MARQLAEAVGYAYIDTGAMYRAVTLYALRHGLLTPDGHIDAPALEQRLGNIDIVSARTCSFTAPAGNQSFK